MRDVLAACLHRILSHYVAHMISLCELRDNGDLVVPFNKPEWWTGRVDYSELTEDDKEMLRVQADNIMNSLQFAAHVLKGNKDGNN